MKNTNKRASLTVEAALIFPVFFFACMALCYLFIYLKTEYTVQRSMFYAARSISSYGKLVEPVAKARNKTADVVGNEIFGDNGELLKSTVKQLAESVSDISGINIDGLLSGATDRLLVGALVEAQLPEGIYRYVSDGSRGFDYSGSVLFDHDKCIEIKCRYELKLPGGMFSDLGIPAEHYLKYRYFCGTEEKSLLQEVTPAEAPGGESEQEEEIVLITDTGYCYHYSYSCPNLNIRPKQVATADIEGMRNSGGAKYYQCEFCVKKKKSQETCYITPEGDRYHYDKKCQGLKRTIYEVKLSEVGKKRACKRCSKEK